MSFAIPLLLFDAMDLLRQGFWMYAPKWFMSFLHVAIYWEGTRIIVFYFRKKYPSVQQTKRRIFLQVIALLLFAFLAGLLLDKLVCNPLCQYFPQLKAMP